MTMRYTRLIRCNVPVDSACRGGRTAGAQLLDCHRMTNETERLRCYDAFAPSTETQQSSAVDERDIRFKAGTRTATGRRNETSRAVPSLIIPHRPNYILHTYSSEPNVAPFLAEDPESDLQHQELKFQISLRVPLYNRMFGENGDLWFAYTQLSFWQAYNLDEIGPVPGDQLRAGTRPDVPHRLFAARPETSHILSWLCAPVERSRRAAVAQLEPPVGQLSSSSVAISCWPFKPWYRIPASSADDNNPDILDFAGRAELRSTYKYGEQVFSFMLRNNLRADDNRSGYELDWSFPFSKRIKGLLQFYNGYGESLIDYNVRTRRAGIGVLVEDWL